MPYTVPEGAKPFTLRIPDDDCSQLHELIKLSRAGPATWENQHQDGRYGVSQQWLLSAKDYWLNKFDWRAQENRINSFPNYKINIKDDTGDIDLHFIGLFSLKEDAIPIVFLHGWPGSFLEFIPMLELLQKKYDSTSLPYHIIVPSLPGYTLSSGPSQTAAWVGEDAARVVNKAVNALGFSKYAVQGGDVGCLVASILAATYDAVAAVHLNLLPSLDQVSADDPSLTAVEKAAIERLQERFLTPTSGAAIMASTRPATLGAVVSSSPLALLAWIGEKFLEWPDDEISIDEILTNVSLYWFTETMPRSIYTYRGTFIAGHQFKFPPFDKPFGFSWFMRELVPGPHKFVATKGDLVFYRQHEKARKKFSLTKSLITGLRPVSSRILGAMATNLSKPIHLSYDNCSWTAPALSHLNFSTDCSIVGGWARTWLTEEDGVNDVAAASYFRQALPWEWRGQLSRGQILDWYYTLHLGHKAYGEESSSNGSGISPWTEYVLEDPFNACLAEVCRTVEWSGVPDILGPGVMINSFIQAILATILGLVALYEWRIRWKRVSASKKQRLVFDAQQANLALFLDASLVLNTSICIATLVLIARRNANGDDTEVTLAHNMVLFSTYACLLPVLVDHAVNGERSRLMSRRACFTVAGVLNFVTNLLAGSVSASLDNPSNWERLCFWDILPRERRVTIPILLTASCVFVVLAP
ncbi:hypothetical protein ACJZ2D_003314 [Fusarium nematophilum]